MWVIRVGIPHFFWVKESVSIFPIQPDDRNNVGTCMVQGIASRLKPTFNVSGRHVTSKKKRYLGNHPMTWSKWLITMVNKGHFPFQMAFKWGWSDHHLRYLGWSSKSRQIWTRTPMPSSYHRFGAPSANEKISGEDVLIDENPENKGGSFAHFLNKRLQNMSIRHFCEMSEM